MESIDIQVVGRLLRVVLAYTVGVATLLAVGDVVVNPTSPITTLEYRITGQELRVSPAALSVPKGIAGSVAVTYTGDAAFAQGAFVSAPLRGSSRAGVARAACPPSVRARALFVGYRRRRWQAVTSQVGFASAKLVVFSLPSCPSQCGQFGSLHPRQVPPHRM
jgi:hypothetical protein